MSTIPPQVLKGIPSNLAAPTKEALAYAVPVATGKIGLEYRRRFWEEDEQIFGGITNTNMDLSTIWYPSYGYLGERGVVVGYYNFGANAVSYGDSPLPERLSRAIAQGRKIHGDAYANELRSSFSVAWQKVRYSEGGWVSWPSRTSGQYARLLGARRPRLLRRRPSQLLHRLAGRGGRVGSQGRHANPRSGGEVMIRRVVVLACAFVLVFAGGVVASQRLAPGWDFSKFPPRQASPPTKSDQAIHNIDVSVPDPFIANGVSVGDDVELYYSSGIGPAPINTAAPVGTPERFIDPAHFPGGVLGAGVTITEAQGMNALARIQDNLATVGLTMRDVLTLRVFMDNAPGAPDDGLRRLQPRLPPVLRQRQPPHRRRDPPARGTADPAPPLVVNPVRPSRTALEVAGLPVAGWLVEIEAVAKRPSGRHRNDD